MSYFESVKIEPGADPIVTKLDIDAGTLDAFGRLRMSLPITLFHSMLVSGNGYTTWDTVESGTANGSTGNWTQNTASYLMTVNASTNTQLLRQTFARTPYTPGKSQQILISCVPGTTVAGITKEIGYGDSNDGLFLSNNGTSWGFMVRSTANGTIVEDFTPQTSWSIDTMNGVGASGYTLNFEKTQIVFIDFEWLGVGQVRFGFVIDGKIIYCHKEDGANKGTSVYMRTPVLPLRHKISGNGAQASSSTIRQICSMVLTEGEQDVHGRTRAISTGTSAIVPTSNWTILKGIRQSANSPSRTILNLTFDVLNTDNNATAEVALILDPAVNGGNLTWTDVTGGFVQETTGNATLYATGGTILYIGYVAGRATEETGQDSLLDMGFTAAGVPRAVLLCARLITGTPDLHGAINYTEA